ncbi:putative quinol monooxygenase [Sphingomonas sp. PAMC 26605]|uniref:putative quinol monooxygenase n=1 Tax=Sphingomonas sp. PAMC 26605 TaxID=1112214 RepID=UPI00026CD7C4|nr:antibiotic biosynthesis monooxygenase [Sphingomonas sp. PAMC 26605]
MLIIAGHVFVAPSDVDAFMTDARATLPFGRSADGNLFFSFTLDDPGEGSVTVLERWRDRTALNAYLARPEVVEIFQRWGGRMRNEVKMYDASNERSPRAD